MRCPHVPAAVLFIIALQPGLNHPGRSSTAPEAEDATVPEIPPPGRSPQSFTRGYQNKVNRLTEGRLEVTDDRGKPAVRGPAGQPVGDVDLKIVWTYTTQYGWNYSLPEFPGGKDAFQSEYPSSILFLERKLAARTILDVSVPDTPYSFYIINGLPSPFLLDSEKMVIWQLNSAQLEQTFHHMRSISASSKTMKFSAGGGDMAAFLVIDFSDRNASPKVKYYEKYHGP